VLRKIPAFRLGVTEATVGQFRRFVEATGYRTTNEKASLEATWNKPMRVDYASRLGVLTYREVGFKQTDLYPVVDVTWFDALAFCNWLSRMEGRKESYKLEGNTATIIDPAGNGYRLPTEAEWEYACRAGTRTRFSCPPGELLDHEWVVENTHEITQPVATKKPNPFGLYDMHGNVCEWCWNRGWEDYKPGDMDLFGSKSQTPETPHVVRGGGIAGGASCARSAARLFEGARPTPASPEKTGAVWWIGFRVARRDQ
jgi:formylglycine-generating enzyme required for sulfatase activity